MYTKHLEKIFDSLFIIIEKCFMIIQRQENMNQIKAIEK